MSDTLDPFRQWQIDSGSASTDVGTWLNQLSAPALSPAFRRDLVAISDAPKHPRHSFVLERFTLGRFCEFRAAMVAASLELVEATLITSPNSELDVRKVDITVLPRGSKPIQLQVKATAENPRHTHAIPVVDGVWLTPIRELKAKLERIIAGALQM